MPLSANTLNGRVAALQFYCMGKIAGILPRLLARMVDRLLRPGVSLIGRRAPASAGGQARLETLLRTSHCPPATSPTTGRSRCPRLSGPGADRWQSQTATAEKSPGAAPFPGA